MDNSLAVQAKQALANLYHWAVDHQPNLQADKKPTTVSSIASQAASLAFSYVESYLNPSHTQQQHPAENSLYIHYQPPHQHHSTAAASSSSSSSTCQPVDHHNAEASSSFGCRNNLEGSSQNPIVAFFQSITHPDCTWRFWDPVASFDSFLWNYTPDIRALQERVLGQSGPGGLSEKYNIDPRILTLALILPLVMLLLAACAVMGTGNKSEDEPPRYPGKESGPTLVGDSGKQKKAGKSESKQHQQQGRGSSISDASSKRGAKKPGGPSDAGASQYLLGNNSGVSSWSALLGSMGFFGGETLDYKPLDILASLKDDTKTSPETSEKDAVGSVLESMSALGGEVMKRIPYQDILDQDIAQLLGSDFLDSDDPTDEEGGPSGVSLDKSLNESVDSADHIKSQTATEIATHKSNKDTTKSDKLEDSVTSDRNIDSVESIKAPTSAKVESAIQGQKKEQEQGKQEHHVQKQEKNSGRQSGQGPAGPGADESIKLPQRVASIPPPLRTRTPRPSSSFKESGRSKVYYPTRVSPAAAKPTTIHHQQSSGNIGRDFGSKIFGFVQDSQLLKNMDSISGGLLGSAVATVVALASTAEATAGVIKNNLPDSVTDFTDELRESFDHAMRVQDSDAGASNKKSWGVRDAISKIMQDDEDNDNIASTQTPIASSATSVHSVSAASATTAPSKAAAATTSTARAPLHSGGFKAPASTPAAGFKPYPAKVISARHTEPVAARIVDIDRGTVMSSAKEEETKSRSSSGGAPVSEEALTQIDKSLSEKFTPSAKGITYADVVAAGAAHSEHEGEDYYLEDVEDSGEEADDDEKGEGEDEDDTDTFVLAEAGDDQEPISARTPLQEHELSSLLPTKNPAGIKESVLVHPREELVRSISSISSSSTGGSIADDELPPTLSTTKSSDTLNKVQEMTVDSHGNKVPVSSEARRDSGYDLLL
ncbi:hypothetical protein BG015_006264 [Linnemannia schmuckeri]|uniref:Uncharacterized protein n=1 Tax=Linnemannia schmuckeri TaxID=64567 RepID=A0A9P5S3G4_9FUNG|nr:hypothetical protein BG015_006264 [Linnemannia schmuckeri]